MRTCVILNPAAGGGTAAERVRRVLAPLPGVELRESPMPGAAGRMAEAAVEDGCSRVVAAGGDGTVSEVATALQRSGRDVECGVIPIGTGNDFALSLGLRGTIHDAVSTLIRGVAVPVDAIGISGGDVHAWNAVVAGFGGRISDRMGGALKRRWGRVSYLRAALGELRELRPHRIGLTVDGRTAELDVLMLVLANGMYAGGGIPLAPGARLDDGWIDVVAIPHVPSWRLPGVVGRVLSGRHLEDPRIIHDRGRRIEVTAGSGFWFNVDGESWGDGAARFEINPRALPFVRPES